MWEILFLCLKPTPLPQKTRLSDKKLFATLADAAERRVNDFNVQDIAKMAWVESGRQATDRAPKKRLNGNRTLKEENVILNKNVDV